MPSTDWLVNLLFVAESFEAANKPYVYNINIHNYFRVQMMDNTAIEALHSIKPENRIAFWDGTGCLGSINPNLNPQKKYSALFNYFLLIKDLTLINEPKWPNFFLSEMITSCQNTLVMKNMLEIMKLEYENKYKKSFLRFRILVCDYSFVFLHATVLVLNEHNLETYAKLIFKLSNADDVLYNEMIKLFTFIVSCVAHTMHRFINGIQTYSAPIKQLAGFCFSLMLNCVDLCSIKTIFKLIVIVFSSKYLTTDCLNALTKLQDLQGRTWQLGAFEHSIQTDAHNCGIIALMIAESLSKNTYSYIFDTNSCHESRAKLAMAIQQSVSK